VTRPLARPTPDRGDVLEDGDVLDRPDVVEGG